MARDNVELFKNKIEDYDGADGYESKSPKVKIIAASGDNIIAVANPALAMSTVIVPSVAHLTEARKNSCEKD
ncbi:hypothetical protein NQ315_002611 [Exocentrus adspersus]|uniref:Uncharacterized protein n=1 Tax=Exocentrus adspersus TaxID=1586481 RepID=A0AAV8VUF1_9CUCU|nr:hypothetical protein NQ315_002611 [Exocentrus adspersus]